jgi:TolA-binding protein
MGREHPGQRRIETQTRMLIRNRQRTTGKLKPVAWPIIGSLFHAVFLRIRHMRSVATIMKALALAGALAFASLSLTGCGSDPVEKDETINWSPQRIYTEAKESMGEGAYDRAIKLFEKLEARYPYGRYAQQAQLEVAYAYYRSLEPRSGNCRLRAFYPLAPEPPQRRLRLLPQRPG